MSQQMALNFDAPAQRHSATSLAAAESIKPFKGAAERKLYEWALNLGSAGFTDLEAQDCFGWAGDFERPRRCWLSDHGYLRDSGRTRPTPKGRQATVWIAIEKH